MTGVARMAVLHMRTVAPYRTQGLLVFAVLMLILARNPDHVEPALAVLLAPLIAVHPFNIAIQFPLLIRFGYARVSVLGTTMPLALVMLAVVRLHLSLASVHTWLPLLWAAGLAAAVTSAVLAVRLPARQS